MCGKLYCFGFELLKKRYLLLWSYRKIGKFVAENLQVLTTIDEPKTVIIARCH